MGKEEAVKWLESEIEHHKGKENESTGTWDRGFHNGAMTEAVVLKGKLNADVRKSKWLVDDVHDRRCTACKAIYLLKNHRSIGLWKYCPRCGALITGEIGVEKL